jgi:hypothetical protein
MEELLTNKAASAEVKKEVIPKSIEKATSQISADNQGELRKYLNKIWKTVPGNFQNPSKKSWTQADPENDCKLLWKQEEKRR